MAASLSVYLTAALALACQTVRAWTDVVWQGSRAIAAAASADFGHLDGQLRHGEVAP